MTIQHPRSCVVARRREHGEVLLGLVEVSRELEKGLLELRRESAPPELLAPGGIVVENSVERRFKRRFGV